MRAVFTGSSMAAEPEPPRPPGAFRRTGNKRQRRIMKPSKLRETGRRDVPAQGAPRDETTATPPVGDPSMPDVGAEALDHDMASMERALDEIARGHAEGMNREDVAKARGATLDLWRRRGRAAGALLPLWLEAVGELSKGRPEGGSVAEGLPKRGA
jgi:hypothetical protein